MANRVADLFGARDSGAFSRANRGATRPIHARRGYSLFWRKISAFVWLCGTGRCRRPALSWFIGCVCGAIQTTLESAVVCFGIAYIGNVFSCSSDHSDWHQRDDAGALFVLAAAAIHSVGHGRLYASCADAPCCQSSAFYALFWLRLVTKRRLSHIRGILVLRTRT